MNVINQCSKVLILCKVM